MKKKLFTGSKWETTEAVRRLKTLGWTLKDFLKEGITVADVEGTICLIKEFYNFEKRLPYYSKKDAYENFLAKKISAYTNPKRNTYRPKFVTWLKSVGYISGKEKIEKQVNDQIASIKNFYSINGRLPNNRKSGTERALRKILHKYCSRTRKSYRKDFHDWAKARGYSQPKWTYEKCKKEALKHKTRISWKKAPGFSYYTAINNDWLDELCAHMMPVQVVHGTWTVKKKCVNEARKYKTIKEWIEKSSGSYSAASNYGWLKECHKHMKNLRPVCKITNGTEIYSSIAEATRATNVPAPNILKVLRGERNQAGGFHWKYSK